MMYEKEYKRVKRAVGKVLKNVSSEGRIVLFGVSDNTRQIIEMLHEYGNEAESIVDNDVRKQGSVYYGVNVSSVQDVLGAYDSHVIIFAYSFYYSEMNAQLENMGYDSRQVFNFRSVWRETEYFRISAIIRGARAYGRIRKKYNKNSTILLCPYTGTGDIYLIGTFLEEFLREKKIQEYIFVVVSKPCCQVASLFKIRNIERITLGESGDILYAHIFAPEIFPLYIMNDSFTYTNPVQWLRGHKSLNFTDMFRIGVFDLDETSRPKILQLEMMKEAEDFVNKNHIDQRTILISPYSNTLSELPKDIWVVIVKALQEKGYRILTNSSGEKEPAIEGTEAVFFPLNQTIQILNYMGGFIGVRSGFCDIASASRCKKIILYDERNYFYAGDAFEYFGLNGMQLCRDAIEIKYGSDINSLVDDVVNQFENVKFQIILRK